MKELKSGVQIMEYMVTTDEWVAAMGGNRPPGMTLTMVSAEEADEYAAKIGGRLPTEEEWEEACGQESAVGAFLEWTSTSAGVLRVNRGGSWRNGVALLHRGAYRFKDAPFIRFDFIGFRVCFDPK